MNKSTETKKMGRPSEGRSIRLQVSVTPELDLWLKDQMNDDEKSVSAVAFRLLEQLRQERKGKTMNKYAVMQITSGGRENDRCIGYVTAETSEEAVRAADKEFGGSQVYEAQFPEPRHLDGYDYVKLAE